MPQSLVDLAAEIQASLSSDAPDIDTLQQHLASNFDFSPEDVRALVYDVALRLNSRLFPPVTQLELILTEGCNLACSYCFEKNMLGHKRMPLDIGEKAVDLLIDYSKDEPALTITHFGGEPTLNFAAIKHITEYAESKTAERKKSIEFTMTSNGMLINDEKADYFSEHRIRVLLSIDGLEATHDRFRTDKKGRGTFHRVIAGMKLLKVRQPYIGVKLTVMPENAASLYNDVLGLYDLGANHFIVGHATGVKWSEDDMNVFTEQWTKLYHWYTQKSRNDLKIDDFEQGESGSFFGCQAGRNSISVTIGGEISPCSKILAMNNKQLLAKLGDVTFGLTHIRNRAELVSCGKVRAACEAEGIADEYQGGCFAANFEDNRDIFQPSRQEHTLSILKRSACAGCACKAN
jgi:uncharacterized protein